jgi:hypothetical protein
MDFIASDYCKSVDDFLETDYPNKAWDHFYKYRLISKYGFDEDIKNFKFIFDIFKKAIKTTDNVVFALEHQQIINEFKNFDSELNIINIDQHHDIIYKSSDEEDVEKYNILWCGTWIYWVCKYKKIKNYHWIMNDTSYSYDVVLNKNKVPNGYREYTLKTLDYDINDIDFDLIFVCLSPQYIHPKHWFYFDLLRVFYEKEKNVKVHLKYDHIKYTSQHLSYKNFKLQNFFKNIKD